MAKTKLPKVSILDRRLKNPFGAGSVPITLKTPGQWEIRWVSSKLRSGHIFDMTHNKGWVFVEPDEIDGGVEEYGFTARESRIVRGDQGEEVLMKMPKGDFVKIQHAKADANLKQLKVQNMRSAVAQSAAQDLGGQAADTIYDAFEHGKVTDSRGEDSDLETESA